MITGHLKPAMPTIITNCADRGTHRDAQRDCTTTPLRPIPHWPTNEFMPANGPHRRVDPVDVTLRSAAPPRGTRMAPVVAGRQTSAEPQIACCSGGIGGGGAGVDEDAGPLRHGGGQGL